MAARDLVAEVRSLALLNWKRDQIEAATLDRDRTIRNAHAHGVSAVKIADAVGLSRQRVYQILDLSATEQRKEQEISG